MVYIGAVFFRSILTGQSNSCVCFSGVFLNKTFLLLFQVLFVYLFCTFRISQLRIGEEREGKEDYIQYELVGVGSPF